MLFENGYYKQTKVSCIKYVQKDKLYVLFNELL